MFLRTFFAQVKSLLRERSAIVVIVAVPVLMTLMFGFLFRVDARPLDLGIFRDAQDPNSGKLLAALTGQFNVSSLGSRADARQKLLDEEIDGALLIPDLSKRGTVELLFDETRIERRQRLQLIDSVVQRLNFELAGGQEVITMTEVGLRPDRDFEGFDFFLPTLIMFGVLLSAMGGVAARLSQEREQGIFKRLAATPLTPLTYLLGEISARVTFAFVQTGLVLGTGILLFDATIRGNIVWIFVLTLIAAAIFASIGTAVASVSSSIEVATGITTTATLFMFFLGSPGTSELFPGVIGRIGSYLPSGPIILQLRTVIIDGTSPFAFDGQTLLLAAWLVVPAYLASRLFKFAPPRKRSS